MQPEQILAFRYARTGLDARQPVDFASAADCPIRDAGRDAALLAVAARVDGVDRDRFDDAVDRGALVLAPSLRGATHALAPEDHALFGRALVAASDDELARQLGHQVMHLCDDEQIAPSDALAEVAAAISDALAGGPLSRHELHDALGETVRDELLPWCDRCRSHHVPALLWRYGAIVAGVRFDAAHRLLRTRPGLTPPASEAATRYLRGYGPATPGEFSRWAGVAPSHGRRLWEAIAEELVELTDPDGRTVWLLADDLDELSDPQSARGVRLLPPGDPYLWSANRQLLVPDEQLRHDLFRPVGAPGLVFADGQLAGTWRSRARRAEIDLEIEPFTRLRRGAIEQEAQRLAEVRGAADARVHVS